MVKASFRLLSSLIALLCVVFLTLQVPSIKKDLIVWLVNKVLDEPDHQIFIEEVEGVFPFSIKIPSLKIKDQQGIWLNLEQLNIKIFYLPFKKNKICCSQYVHALSQQWDWTQNDMGFEQLSATE